jgi:hypothetical protein
VLIRLVIDATLGHDGPRTVSHQRQQMHAAARAARGAAQRLAVDAQHGPQLVRRVREAVVDPLVQHPLQGLGIELQKQVAKAVSLGRPAGEAQAMAEVNG